MADEVVQYAFSYDKAFAAQVLQSIALVEALADQTAEKLLSILRQTAGFFAALHATLQTPLNALSNALKNPVLRLAISEAAAADLEAAIAAITGDRARLELLISQYNT